MSDKDSSPARSPLPTQACLPINHCNLPCQLLGSLQFQRHPQPLRIDGVQELHRQLFSVLEQETEPVHRAVHFAHHMKACFQLDHPEEVGFDGHGRHPGRTKADYRQLLRGWLFNADGMEGAIIKGWVESRFGLLARNHGQPLPDRDGQAYGHYQAELAQGLYNTNALLSQLDLLYSYCQYELTRQRPGHSHLTLYRGTNRLDQLEIVATPDKRHRVLLLNNINSFSGSRERADEFGDQIIATRAPLAKLLFVPGLIPGLLQGEEEHLVIGGLYEVELLTV